jgi:hypothetical protein
VRIFKSRWFQRFARKEGITDSALVEAVARAEKGQIDADLGGGVIKQRIGRPGQGKSKGYRTIIFFRRDDIAGTTRAFFVYGFAKSQGRTLMNMRKSSSRKPQSTSWRWPRSNSRCG